MLLIHLLKILFCLVIIRHTIKWISYHWRHRNKKARAFHGNTRMPKELEFALKYGLFAKRKKRFKDLSYRKSLAQWKVLLNTIYPQGSGDVNIGELSTAVTENFIPSINRDLESQAYTPMKSEEDLFANGTNPSFGGKVTSGNQKRFPFPKLKTGNNNFSHGVIPLLFSIRISRITNTIKNNLLVSNRGLSFERSRGGHNLAYYKTSNINARTTTVKILKFPKNPNPFPKATIACR